MDKDTMYQWDRTPLITWRYAQRFRIDDLPDEILAMVFNQLVPRNLEADYDVSSWGYIHCWTRVASVCRKWNAITLRWPSLWSHILLPAPKRGLDAFLERSRNAPLSVTIHVDCRQLAHVLDAAGERLRNIHFHKVPVAWITELVPHWKGRMSQLRRIHFDRDRLEFMVFPEERHSYDTLPFTQEHIEELILKNVDWRPIPFQACTSLRVLTLEFEERARTHQRLFPHATVSEIAAILRAQPQLTDVTLLLYWSDASRAPSVSLPHLQSLTLGYDALAGQALLESLTYPDTASIRLGFRRYRSKDGRTLDKWTHDECMAHWTPILDKVSRQPAPFIGLTLMPYRFISWSDKNLVRLSAWTTRMHSGEELRVTYRGLFDSFDGTVENTAPPALSLAIPLRLDVLDKLLDKLDLSRVARLWLYGLIEGHIDVEAARVMLKHTLYVRIVMFGRSALRDIVRLVEPEVVDDGEYVQCVLPCMSIINMRNGVVFNGPEKDQAKWAWKDFLDALAERERCGWERVICASATYRHYLYDDEQCKLVDDYFSETVNPDLSPNICDWKRPAGDGESAGKETADTEDHARPTEVIFVSDNEDIKSEAGSDGDESDAALASSAGATSEALCENTSENNV